MILARPNRPRQDRVTFDGVQVELGGVPETLLWTLYHRAIEARRPDAVQRGPKAVELVDAIDYPFAERFGTSAAVLSQWQALRVRRFDIEVRRFLLAHPDGTVVALGEGLEAQFWRVDNGRVRRVTGDLRETIAVRDRLLPGGDCHSAIAGSALEEGWMDAVDLSRGVLITAQGTSCTSSSTTSSGSSPPAGADSRAARWYSTLSRAG